MPSPASAGRSHPDGAVLCTTRRIPFACSPSTDPSPPLSPSLMHHISSSISEQHAASRTDRSVPLHQGHAGHAHARRRGARAQDDERRRRVRRVRRCAGVRRVRSSGGQGAVARAGRHVHDARPCTHAQPSPHADVRQPVVQAAAAASAASAARDVPHRGGGGERRGVHAAEVDAGTCHGSLRSCVGGVFMHACTSRVSCTNGGGVCVVYDRCWTPP